MFFFSLENGPGDYYDISGSVNDLFIFYESSKIEGKAQLTVCS